LHRLFPEVENNTKNEMSKNKTLQDNQIYDEQSVRLDGKTEVLGPEDIKE